MLTLTLHDGRVVDINESAWPKFFDIRLEVQPTPSSEDIAHGRLILSFAVPGTRSAGAQPLRPDEGAMVVISNNGRFSLQ